MLKTITINAHNPLHYRTVVGFNFDKVTNQQYWDKRILDFYDKIQTIKIHSSFIGLRVNVNESDEFMVKISDDKAQFGAKIKPGEYTTTRRTWHTNWKVKVTDTKTDEVILDYTLGSLEGKTILIHLDSGSLGDNVIWFPQIEEFRKQNKCKVICWWTNNKYIDLDINSFPFLKSITTEISFTSVNSNII